MTSDGFHNTYTGDGEPNSLPSIADEVDFPDEQRDGDQRWIVLYPEDYDQHILDTEGNLGILVDIDQTDAIIRIAGQIIASLSSEDVDGDDVIEGMMAGLEEVRDGE